MTAVFEYCPEGGYIAYIREIPGVNSQGDTLEEANSNLEDALSLVLSEFPDLLSI